MFNSLDKSRIVGPLGAGRRSEVFRLRNGDVLKLLREGFPASIAQSEFAATTAAKRAGLPVWHLRDLVAVEGRVGLVGEYVDGRNVSDVMQRRPWTSFRMVTELATTQWRFHRADVSSTAATRQPGLAQAMRHLAEQPADLIESVRTAIVNGERNGFCHGDYHGGNVKLDGAGMTVLDLERAGVGDIALDAARTVAWLGLGPTPATKPAIGEWAARRWLWEKYVARYGRLSGMSPAPVLAWSIVEFCRRGRRTGAHDAVAFHLPGLARRLRRALG